MASPYVQMVVDVTRKQVVQGSFSLQPAAWHPFATHQLGVIHDTRGRVVLRASHASGPYVVGVATWQGDRTVQRQGISPTLPNDFQWQIIDAQIAQGLHHASGQPPPQTAADAAPWIDDGVLLREDTPEGNRARLVREGKLAPQAPAPTEAGGSPSPLAKIGGAILTVLVLAGIGGYIYFEHWWKKGSVANGDACRSDSECRSKICDRKPDGTKRCAAMRAYCRSSSDCDGGRCDSSGMCLRPSAPGGSCSVDSDCQSRRCTRSNHGLGKKLCE